MDKIYQKSFSGGKNAGFTLIELLVVVLIIGILAAVAVPQYEKAVKKARAAKLLPWIQSLQQAQQLYYLNNGKYATCFNDLEIDLQNFTVQNENNGCATRMFMGEGTNKITMQIFRGGGLMGVFMGNFMNSGFGGYGVDLQKNSSLSCAEYACHAVESGSFCKKVLGTAATPATNEWCIRLFPLP